MEQIQFFINLYKVIKPILEISILAFLLYKAYKIIMGTNSAQILKAGILIGICYAFVNILNLTTLKWILNSMLPVFVVGFAIVFQPEVRKIFLKLGQINLFAPGKKTKHTYVDAALIAADSLSKKRRGMILIFQRQSALDNILQSGGTKLNADLSSALLVTIYGHDTPLHDGACVVREGKIVAAGCFLPPSEQYDIKKTFGSRHRAALGICEVSDAVALVVSEETGAISLAYDSQLHYDLSRTELIRVLENLLSIRQEDKVIEDSIDEHK